MHRASEAHADEHGEDQRDLEGRPPGLFHIRPVRRFQMAGDEQSVGRVV